MSVVFIRYLFLLSPNKLFFPGKLFSLDRLVFSFFCLFFFSGLHSFLGVRVLLEDKPIKNGVLWALTSTGNFTVSNFNKSVSKKKKLLKASRIVISLSDGPFGKVFAINGRKLKISSLLISSTKGKIGRGIYDYEGSFLILRDGSRAFLINLVELEDYVKSGLRSEMLPGWPRAALEAGAIVYRTYVLTAIRDARLSKSRGYKKRPYDVCSTNADQVYKGVHKFASIHNAVKRTKGLVVTYLNEPIYAQYDACCGGSIPSGRSGFDFKKFPYLSRRYACNFCKKFSYYNWSVTYSLENLSKLLSGALGFGKIKSKNNRNNKKSKKSKNSFKKSASLKKPLITDIKISDIDRSGVVHKLNFKVTGISGSDRWLSLSSSRLLSCCQGLKSCTLSLKKSGKKVTFCGRGYGHQMGLCQWGAFGLAKRGLDFKRILRFYYPGISISRINRLPLQRKLFKR